MKKLVLASLCCPAFAQQPIPNIGVWHAMQNIQDWQKHQPLLPRLAMPGSNVTIVPSRVCSVPLLEVPTREVDPGILHKAGPVTHGDTIPESHLPAPACPKQ
jgi:hypothetical protein